MATAASAPSAPAAPPSADAEPSPLHDGDEDRAASLAALPRPIVESVPRFSPDGRTVAFVANFDGARSLYVADVDGKTPPRKVTVVPARFRRPVFSPDGRSVCFSSDSDGDEAFSIFRVALDGGAITELTAGEKRRRDDGPMFSPGGERFFFSGRRMGEHGVVLFEQPTSDGTGAKQVFADEGRDFAGLRPDGKQLAIVEANLSRSLWIVDLPATKPPRMLYPAGDPVAKKARIDDIEYAPDGGRIFVATNDGGDRKHLLALDPGTGRELARFTEMRSPGGDVQGLVVAGKTVAYVVDLGTHHELRILDAHTLKERPPAKLALGSEEPGSRHPNSSSGIAISPDGKRIAIQWSTPSAPGRVFLVDTATGATSPLDDVARAATPSIVAESVRIKSFDGLEIPALLYLPKDGGKHPVVMSIHGGFPFAATARYDAWISMLVGRGFAVVEPNVRGASGFGPAFESADNGVLKLNGVRDHGAVGRWIAAQPWADPARMAVMGGSAGGYYTLMALGHYPELWRAGLAIVPIYDVALAVRTMDAGLRSFMEQRELVPLTETGAIAALSPSTYVDRIRAPLFVYAGAKDVRTPPEQVDALVRDLRSRGRVVEYMRAANAGHSRDARDAKTATMQDARMLRFLEESLR